METKQPRGHELRTCCHCGGPVKVFNSDARNGAGKYCSTKCSDAGRSWFPKIVAMLPCTSGDVAAALGIKQHPAAHAMRRACDRGLIHPSGVTRNVGAKPGQASMTLLYSAGPQSDPNVPAGNLRAALSYFTDKMILAAMPGSQSQIVDRTGLTLTTVVKRLLAMRKVKNETGWQTLCFIRSYKRTLGGHPGPFIAVYDRGPGKDQPCKLKPRTQREKYERWRDRAARSGKLQQVAKEKSEKRQRRIAERRQMRQGDFLLNAFFGSPADRRKQDRRAGE